MKRWDRVAWDGSEPWDEPIPPVFRELARRYEIELRPSTSRMPAGTSHGFPGYSFHADRRIAFLPAIVETAKAFHEMVHVVVQPPWLDVDDLPEDLFLLQFERALARSVFGPCALNAVVSFQEVTESGFLHGEELGSIPGYQRTTVWRRGVRLCRALDLLTDKNKPTFRLPRWERIDETLRREIVKLTRQGFAIPEFVLRRIENRS